MLFAAPGCAWGGQRGQSCGSSDGEEPLFQEDKIVKKTSLSLDSFGTKWHQGESGGLLVLERRMIFGNFLLASHFHGRGAFRGIYQALSI